MAVDSGGRGLNRKERGDGGGDLGAEPGRQDESAFPEVRMLPSSNPDTSTPNVSRCFHDFAFFFFPLNSRMKNQACRTGLHSETTTVDSQENCPLSSLRGMVALWVTSACLHRPSIVPALGPVPGGVQPPLSHQASSSSSPLPSPPAAPPEGRSLLTGVFIL